MAPIWLYHYPNQIETLDNGDIILGGYILDNDQKSLTFGEWGWLVRTDSMGCSLCCSQYNNACVGVAVEDIYKNEEAFTLYPNPVSSDMHIQFKEASKGVISITDLSGKEIIQKNIDNQLNYSIDVSSLTNGLYFITYEDAQGQRSVRKFVVNR